MRILFTIVFCALAPFTICALEESNAETKTLSAAAEVSISTDTKDRDRGVIAGGAETAAKTGQKLVPVKLKPVTYVLLSISAAIGPILIFLLFRQPRR